MTPLETATFSPGGKRDASGQTQTTTGRIDIAKQVRQLRGIVACSFLSGVTVGIASLLGAAAYMTSKDPVPPLVMGGFFTVTGLFFGALAVGIAKRLHAYIYNSELIIAAQDRGLQELQADKAWLVTSVLFGGASAPTEGAAPRGAGDLFSLGADAFTDCEPGARGGVGKGSPSARVIHPDNARTGWRFRQ